MNVEQRITNILKAKEQWLFGDAERLNKSIQLTIDSGFEKSDVFFALRWIRDVITQENLENWVNEFPLVDSRSQKVLFFHAGNLPLVGFQDVIAALLSGVQYFGKLSRKDAFLLPDFLEEVKKTNAEWKIEYSTEILPFFGINADTLIFSGSESSAKEVENLAKTYSMIHHDAKKLMRTAHFSIAWLRASSEEAFLDLVEAVLRYNGEGCRSVHIIVAPFDLYDSGCDLSDVIESWWIKTKRSKQVLSENQRYYYAYFRSVGIPVMSWENKIVVQTSEISRLIPGCVYWIKGGLDKVDELKLQFGEQIQSIYGLPNSAETISKAQNPDLNWKPDGSDILQFLGTLN